VAHARLSAAPVPHAQAAEQREYVYDVQIAYLQIYLDQLSDLLDPEAQIDLREDPKEGVYVSGARWHTVHNTKDAMAVIEAGNENRNTACTKMNADSSRSHAVLIMNLRCTGGLKTLNGKLFLVDLAGSERVKKSGVEG
jgi:kinesin family protein 5